MPHVVYSGAASIVVSPVVTTLLPRCAAITEATPPWLPCNAEACADTLEVASCGCCHASPTVSSCLLRPASALLSPLRPSHTEPAQAAVPAPSIKQQWWSSVPPPALRLLLSCLSSQLCLCCHCRPRSQLTAPQYLVWDASRALRSVHHASRSALALPPQMTACTDPCQFA